MSGSPKVLIAERDVTELEYYNDYCLDITDILPLTESAKVTYDGDDRPNVATYYRSATQTTANRVAEVDVSYDSEDRPDTVACRLYKSDDGTTLLKTITLTYTYTGDNVTNVSRAIV